LARTDRLEELVESCLLLSFRVRMNVDLGLRASNNQLSHVYGDLDARPPARALTGAFCMLVNDEGGLGGTPWRIVDRIHAKRRQDPGRRQLFDATAECPQLVDRDVEGTARE